MKNSIAKAVLLPTVLLSLFLATGCSSTGPLTSQQATYPASKVDAKGVFSENCATCHGVDGRAQTLHGRLIGAKDLTNPQWQAQTTDAKIVNAIKTGPGAMPSFAQKLSASEIQALASYVRSFKSIH
jgi:cbb3-type cytochrome c oxidase subunit III